MHKMKVGIFLNQVVLYKNMTRVAKYAVSIYNGLNNFCFWFISEQYRRGEKSKREINEGWLHDAR